MSIDQILNYDPGYHVEGAFGIHIARYFRLEEAISWREYAFDTGASNVDETQTAVSFVTNFYWDFLGVDSSFDPYLGVGTGVAIWDRGGSDAGDFDAIAGFLFNTMVGANYHINDHLAFGTSYRFTYSIYEDDKNFGSDEVQTQQFNHSILGTVTVVF